jgi:epoxide hydrolase-like predicted phosphatase
VSSDKKNLHKSLTTPHSRYRNIIFDLGGVLINYKPRKLIEQAFKEHDEKPWYLLDVIKSPEYLEIDRGTITPEEAITLLAPHFPDRPFKEHCTTLLQHLVEQLVPLDAGVNILHKVRAQGFKTYILSNLSALAHQKIAAYDFLSLFDGAVFSYHIKMVKPKIEIYQHLLTTYQLKPEECLFIDDLEANIKGAKAAGIDGIVCEDHDYVVEELKKRGIFS